MRWHDKRGGAQRARCIRCARTDSGRPENLRGLKLGAGTQKCVAALVVQGFSEVTIIDRLKMSPAGAKGQMDWIVKQAQDRYAQEHPGVGSGWRSIATPSGYIVAVGKQTRGFRIVDWVPQENRGLLEAVVGANTADPPKPDGMSGWLAKVLGPTGHGWEEIEQRLWIAMAHTNRWIKD